jgi:hypothetical protein
MIAFAGVIPLLIAVLASTTLASADAHHYGDFASSRVEARRSPSGEMANSASSLADQAAALMRPHGRLGDPSRFRHPVFATNSVDDLAGAACRTNSFVPSTLVLMADGSSKPIEDG